MKCCVCRCQIADATCSRKPLYVEIHNENVILELPNVLAMASFESSVIILVNNDNDNADHVWVSIYTISEDSLKLSEPREHELYTCRPNSAEPLSHFAIVTAVSFHRKSYNGCSHSSDVLDISDGLFNVLFGLELNLSRCAVLLLYRDPGLVMWLPTKSVVGKPASVQVLCSLGDSLVRVLTLSSIGDDGSSQASFLVLIGHHGRVLVISLTAGALVPSYQHYDVFGPVHCCTLAGNSCLLYSTANELYVADLAKSVKCGQSGSIKSTALGISGVSALCAIQLSQGNDGTALGKVLILLL